MAMHILFGQAQYRDSEKEFAWIREFNIVQDLVSQGSHRDRYPMNTV